MNLENCMLTLRFYVILAVLLSGGFLRAETTLSFTLDDSYMTSAGVFRPDGSLIRTLWGKVRYAPGTHSFVWDDKNDLGVEVPAGDYTFKVIHHNIDYTWEGVIGNTSSRFNGVIRRGFIPIVDMATDGPNLYSALSYNEGQSQIHVSTTADSNNLTFAIPPSICTTMSHVASDGTLYYMANTGGGFDSGRNATFIIARRVSDNAIHSFSTGTSLCLQRFPGSTDCYAEHLFASCINVIEGKSNPPTGMAVQKNGPFLAVAQGKLNEVRLLDKVTGAQISTIGITSPRKIAFAPNGDLWVISGTTVQRFAAAMLGSTGDPVNTMTGFARPESVSVHPSDDNIVLVADGGASQQVKAFDSVGNPLWTYGTLGGGYADDPTISESKLGFIANRTFVTALADGSFWVSDPRNNRSLHFTAEREFIEQIHYIPASYVATCDPNQPTRVIGGDWFEYEVDYSKPLQPGDPMAVGGSGVWKLKKNWGIGAPADLIGTGAFQGLHTVVTLGNGKTYGLAFNFKSRKHAVVELPATGNLRMTGIELSFNQTLYANGDLRLFTYTSPHQIITQQSLTGFDASDNPFWGPSVQIARHTGGARYGGAFTGPAGPRFPVTSSNLMISFNGAVTSTGRHLGGVEIGSTSWKWLASPSVDKAYYETYEGQDGTFSNGNGVQYAGNQVHASDRNVIYGYHGEFYNGGQANQFMHFRDDGLFLGQFGTASNAARKEANYGQGGNSFSLSLVKVDGETYLWHNDESNHGGVHRWRLTGANSVGELSASGSLGGAVDLGSSSTEVPELIMDNTDPTGIEQNGAWTVSTTTGRHGENHLHDGNTDKGTKSVRFTPALPKAGYYEVYGWWSAHPNRSGKTPIDINHFNGTSTIVVDQRHPGTGSRWNLLGVYHFQEGAVGNVLVRNDGTDGYAFADAFKFVYDRARTARGEAIDLPHPDLTVSESQLKLGMQTWSGYGYRLRSSTDLKGPWLYRPEGDLKGDGNYQETDFPRFHPAEFFRYLVEPAQ